jgi:hypothetical protein
MTDQNEPNTEKGDMRIMWIATAVIVLGILGAMGINMLVHHDAITATPEMSVQSPAIPPK